MKRHASAYAYPYVFWMIVFIIVPLLLVAWYGLFDTSDGQIRFTLEHLERFFTTPVYWQVFLRSIVLALISTVICLLIGYPLAYILSGPNVKHKSFLLMLIMLPMWMSFLLRTYAWLTILEKNGLLNQILSFLHLPEQNILYTPAAVVLGIVYNYLPFMIIPIYNVLEKMDHSLIEAASDLGASKGRVFRKVVFPLSIPGVVSGITMTFMPSVTTFIISSLLGGGKINVIGNVIEQQFSKSNNWNFGSALSLILIIIVLLSMRFMNTKDDDSIGGGIL